MHRCRSNNDFQHIAVKLDIANRSGHQRNYAPPQYHQGWEEIQNNFVVKLCWPPITVFVRPICPPLFHGNSIIIHINLYGFLFCVWSNEYETPRSSVYRPSPHFVGHINFIDIGICIIEFWCSGIRSHKCNLGLERPPTGGVVSENICDGITN
jgi:hypothetical protein